VGVFEAGGYGEKVSLEACEVVHIRFLLLPGV
jgi:hypothetical protein